MENDLKVYDIFKEVYATLTYSDSEVISKIPDHILQKIMLFAANSNIEPAIDVDKELSEQSISEEAQSILAVLWQLYMSN